LLSDAPKATQLKKVGSHDCERFVLSADGFNVAALAGNSVTFFRIRENEIFERITLQEPGTIRALEFGNADSVITSTSIEESLSKITHTLSINDHEKRICEEQTDRPGDKDTVDDCNKLGFHIRPVIFLINSK
jgi:hypothetical protein